MCRNALAARTLPSNRGLPATVVITMGIDQLETAAGVATTATGGIVPIRDALAMATDAYPVLCLFDTDGNPCTSAAVPAWPPPPNASPCTPETADAPGPAATCPPSGLKCITWTNTNTAA